MSGFDWAGWIDAERQAAEQRTGLVAAEALVRDARYARALDLWKRHERLASALASTEAEARAMGGGETR